MKRSRWLSISIALAVGAALSLLLPSLLAIKVFHGTDILQRHAPWLESPPDGITVTNPLIGDTVDAHLPAIAEMRERIHDGDLPMWSSYNHGGGPFAPMAHSGLFNPFNAPYWVLPLHYAPGLVKLLELVAAIGFTFLFLRRQGLGRHAAVLGGLIYAFSGFQVAWTNWSHPHVAALIPALLWAIDRAISARTLKSAIPLAGVMATMWMIGFPSVTGYALAFGGIFALCKLGWVSGRKRLRAGVSPLIGVVVGTGLAAFLLLPFSQWLGTIDLAARQQDPGATLARRTLATLAVPNAFGSPVFGNYFGPADYFIYGPVNWVENQAFIGIMALVLVAVAVTYGGRVLSKSTQVFLLLSVSICLVLIYIGGPILALAQSLPLFGSSHVGRLRSVMLFLLAALAATGFEVLANDRSHRKRRPVLLSATVLGIGAVVGYGLLRAHEMALETGHEGFFWNQMAVAGGVAIVALGLLIVRRSGARWTWPLLLIPMVVAFEVITFAGPWWPQIDHEAFYPTTDAHVFLQEHLGDERMVVTGMTMLPSSNAFYGLRSVTAHSFPTGTWADLLLAVDPGAFRLSPTFSSIEHSEARIGSAVLDRMAARFAVTDPRQRVFGVRVDSGTATSRTVLEPGWSFDLSHSDDLQALVLDLTGGYTATSEDGPAVFRVDLLTADGRIVGSSQRRLTTNVSRGEREIAVTLPSEPASVMRLHYVSGAPVEVATLDGGSPVVAEVIASDTTPRVVFAGGAVIYERSGALDRIRWASDYEVIEDPILRVESLADRGPETVILARTPAATPATGGPASFEFMEVSDDRMVIGVEADGAGHLVVMDSLVGMWTATLNGVAVDLVPADHAGAAVAVPAGTHTLILEADPPGWRTGRLVTLGSMGLVALILITGRRTRQPEDRSS